MNEGDVRSKLNNKYISNKHLIYKGETNMNNHNSELT